MAVGEGYHITQEAVQHVISLDTTLKGALEETIALLEESDKIGGEYVVSLHAEVHDATGWSVIAYCSHAHS